MLGQLNIIHNVRNSKQDVAECQDCKTEFYIDKARMAMFDQIKCNGKVITVCPWCREDSKKWENGRGL